MLNPESSDSFVWTAVDDALFTEPLETPPAAVLSNVMQVVNAQQIAAAGATSTPVQAIPSPVQPVTPISPLAANAAVLPASLPIRPPFTRLISWLDVVLCGFFSLMFTLVLFAPVLTPPEMQPMLHWLGQVLTYPPVLQSLLVSFPLVGLAVAFAILLSSHPRSPLRRF